MWKRREEEKPWTSPAGSDSPGVSSQAPAGVVPAARANAAAWGEMARIGKSVTIRGELSGSEDLYIDGEVQGSIDLQGHSLTLGPNGRVRANVRARTVVIHGKMDGNVHGSEKVELKSSGVLVGDITTKRIAIEEGGFLKGKVELNREEAKTDTAAQPRPSAASAGPPTLSSTAAAASPGVAEHKK